MTTNARTQDVDAAALQSLALENSGTTLVKFGAEWCSACKYQDLIFANLGKADIGDATIVTIDVDRHPDIADAFGVRTLPTMVVLEDGKEAARAVGTRSLASLRALLAPFGARARERGPT